MKRSGVAQVLLQPTDDLIGANSKHAAVLILNAVVVAESKGIATITTMGGNSSLAISSPGHPQTNWAGAYGGRIVPNHSKSGDTHRRSDVEGTGIDAHHSSSLLAGTSKFNQACAPA